MRDCADKYRTERKGKGCPEIQFASADKINGPLHTNDENLLICGDADVRPPHQSGRHAARDEDRHGRGRRRRHGPRAERRRAAATPRSMNTPTGRVHDQRQAPGAAREQPVARGGGHEQLEPLRRQDLHPPAQHRDGHHQRRRRRRPTSRGRRAASSTSPTAARAPRRSRPTRTTTSDSGCGNVYVSGTYAKPLTIAAANDVIIKPTSSAVAERQQHHAGRQRVDPRADRQQLRARRAPRVRLQQRQPR